MTVSGLAAPRLTTLRPGPRRFLSVVSAMLLAACVAAMVGDVLERRASMRAALDLGLARRQPVIFETMEVLEDGGAATLVIAEGLLERNAAVSRNLLLDVAGRRPGSAYGRLLLGRSAPSGSGALWARPLELAVSAAPGLNPAAVTLAQRYLAEWPVLLPGDRLKGEVALRRAFFDRGFLLGGLIPAVRAVGPEAAVRALPEDPVTLRAAARILKESGADEAAGLVAARLQALPPARGASRSRP